MTEDTRFIICSIIAIIFWGGVVYLGIMHLNILLGMVITVMLLILGGALVVVTATGLMDLWDKFK